MRIWEFVRGKKYSPSIDLEDEDGDMVFKAGDAYMCVDVLDGFVVLNGIDGRQRVRTSWASKFEVVDHESRGLDDILSDLYDAHQNGNVSKKLLDEYRDLTGNDRPGFMK